MIKVNQKIFSKSWPFEEARKILKKVNNAIPEKGYVLFETGYGPSGFPHIGTFGEIVRTMFVKKAFSVLAPDIPTKLFVVSDDYDAIRKIPDNVPNPEMLKDYLGQPLTNIPDPFNEHESYGNHMNNKLKEFMGVFDIDYQFISASEYYKSGKFDKALTVAAENYDKLMSIMLPTLGEDRQKTYSPFMPIDKKTGVVLNEGVISVDAKNQTITYKDSSNEIITDKFTGGNCKLQWKCDFGMRWADFDVDYEIYGKDHYPNEKIYRSICRVFKQEPPVNYFYELFLDKDNKKISKSKGNGVNLSEWFEYSTPEVLSLYMFNKPKVAKRLYFEIIPKTFDEYLSLCKSYRDAKNDDLRMINPIFFCNDISGDIPDITYSLLLNIASVASVANEETLWAFLSKYNKDWQKGKYPILDKMVKKAVVYCSQIVIPQRSLHVPNEEEKSILRLIVDKLNLITETNDKNVDVNNFQNVIHDIVKEIKVESKDIYLLIYKVIFGCNTGPRFGSFVALYGKNNAIKLIKELF